MPKELTQIEQIYYDTIIKMFNIWIESENSIKIATSFLDNLVDELLKKKQMKKIAFRCRFVVKNIDQVEKEDVLEFIAQDVDEANEKLHNFCKIMDVYLVRVIEIIEIEENGNTIH